MTNKELSRWEQAINALVAGTQDHELQWVVVDSKIYLSNEDTSGVTLSLKYKDQYLLLYRKAYTYTVPTDSFLASAIGSSIGQREKVYKANLCIYDNNAKVNIYEFPYSELTEDLYKAATYNAAKVDQLLDSIIKQPNLNKLPKK